MGDLRTTPGGGDLDRLIGRLYRYALAVRHDPEAAEDAVHDALVRVCANGGPWDEAYLMRAVRHRALDAIKSDRRREKRARARAESSLALPSAGDLAREHDHSDGRLGEALASLRPIEREALYLAVVEGMKIGHVAAAMGRPRGSVLSLIHRAKARLRDALAEYAGGRRHE